MAITQAVANSFKQEVLEGKHDFQFSGGDVFKFALYTLYCNVKFCYYSIPRTTVQEIKLLILVNILQGGGVLVKPNPSTSVCIRCCDC
jgi:hypothetical protein